MKISKLLQLLFGFANLFSLGVVPDGGGGGDPVEPPTDPVEPPADPVEPPTDPTGKSKPTDAEAKLLKEVMDKKTALRKTQAELDEVKQKLANFDGIDPTDVKALLDEKKALETRKLEEKGEWDRLKAQMAEENQKTVNAVLEQLSAAEQTANALASQVAELTVGNAFAGSTFIKEELTLPASKARALYGPHFAFEDGQVVAYDKPAGSAQRTRLVDAAGEPLAFEAALKKLVDADPDRDQITRTKVKSGSGSKATDKGSAPPASFDEMRGVDRIAAALKIKK